jgi:hypothetical protein
MFLIKPGMEFVCVVPMEFGLVGSKLLLNGIKRKKAPV